MCADKRYHALAVDALPLPSVHLYDGGRGCKYRRPLLCHACPERRKDEQARQRLAVVRVGIIGVRIVICRARKEGTKTSAACTAAVKARGESRREMQGQARDRLSAPGDRAIRLRGSTHRHKCRSARSPGGSSPCAPPHGPHNRSARRGHARHCCSPPLPETRSWTPVRAAGCAPAPNPRQASRRPGCLLRPSDAKNDA